MLPTHVTEVYSYPLRMHQVGVPRKTGRFLAWHHATLWSLSPCCCCLTQWFPLLCPRFVQVNAFSRDAFGGNPAAVCYLPYFPSDDWLQQVAAEFNLSETAFVVRRRGRKATAAAAAGGEAGGSRSGSEAAEAEAERRRSSSEFDLRWFTPTMEVQTNR